MSAAANGKPTGSVATPPAGTESDAELDLLRTSCRQAIKGLPSGFSAATAGTLWRAFVRVAPLALFAGVLTAALAVGAVYLVAPPKYPVSVLIKVNSSKAGGGIGGNTQEDVEFSMRKSFQMELVKSPNVINKALEMQVKDLTKGMKGAPVDSRFVKELPLVQAEIRSIGCRGSRRSRTSEREIIVVSGTTRDRRT